MMLFEDLLYFKCRFLSRTVGLAVKVLFPGFISPQLPPVISHLHSRDDWHIMTSVATQFFSFLCPACCFPHFTYMLGSLPPRIVLFYKGNSFLRLGCPNCRATVGKIAVSRAFSPMIYINTLNISLSPISGEISLIIVKFQDPSFKSMVYLARNEQSIETFSVNCCDFVLMEFVCQADEQPNIILITPVTLGRTLILHQPYQGSGVGSAGFCCSKAKVCFLVI